LAFQKENTNEEKGRREKGEGRREKGEGRLTVGDFSSFWISGHAKDDLHVLSLHTGRVGQSIS